MNKSETLQFKRPDSLSKTAEEHIRQGILDGTFQLGESLPEAKLSQAMGISKTPIREALAALKLQGLVQIIRQRGAFVFSLSQEDVVQLCQYRLILETVALDQALDNSRPALLNELEGIVSRMSKARDADAFQLYWSLMQTFTMHFSVTAATAICKTVTKRSATSSDPCGRICPLALSGRRSLLRSMKQF